MVGCKLSCSAKDARKTANKGKGRYKCWTAHGLVLMQNERDGDVANHISMQAHVIFLISFHDETTYVFCHMSDLMIKILAIVVIAQTQTM